MRIIKKLFANWLINILAIYIASVYISSDSFIFDYGSWQNLLLVALGFTVIALLIKPFVKLLAIPFGVIGIFFFAFFNAAALYAVALFVPGFVIGSVTSALIAGVAIGIINFILHLIMR